MRTSFLGILFVIGFVLPGFGAYSVYFFTGTVEIILKSTPPVAITNINQVVDDNASLKLVENAEVILKDEAGKFAIIHSAGVYNNIQIRDIFKAQQGKSLVSSLAGFLGNEITRSHVDERKMAESYMKQKGGVTRGGSIYPLMLWPAYGSSIVSNDVRFVWNSGAKKTSYEIIIFGGEDANNPVQLGKSITTDTFMDVSFKDFGVTKDAYFSWVVYPEGDPNHSRFTFKIITPDETKRLMEEVLLESQRGVTPEDKELLKAAGYEKNGLISLADATYKELIMLNNNATNQDLYTLFRLRNNLVN